LRREPRDDVFDDSAKGVLEVKLQLGSHGSMYSCDSPSQPLRPGRTGSLT
jgi:hypothetical protein